MLRKKHIAMIVLATLIAGAAVVGVVLAGGCGEPQVIEVKAVDEQVLPSTPVPTISAKPVAEASPQALPVARADDFTGEADEGADEATYDEAAYVMSYIRTDTEAPSEVTEIILDAEGAVLAVSWSDSSSGAYLETSGWQWSVADDGTEYLFHEWTESELQELAGDDAAWGLWVFYVIGTGDGTELYERGDFYDANDGFIDGWASTWQLTQ